MFLALFIGELAFIGISGMQNDYKKADLIVVFGNEVMPDGSLSDRLKARLDEAIKIYKENFSERILVSGGIGKEGFDEAQKMNDYLVTQGIPEDHVWQDKRGLNTYATAQNASTLMKENGWDSVILVSQFFHLPRAKVAFSHAGIQIIYQAHPDFYEMRDAYSLFREFFAYNSYLLK